MTDAAHRAFKDRLYGQFARIGKALSSPHRLELLELLAQGERTVDALATESGLSIANASQHLQTLREAGLVESSKRGLYVHYRLADDSVFAPVDVIANGRRTSPRRARSLVREHFGDRSDPEPVGMHELLRRASSGQVVVLDTRPALEYAPATSPARISIPVDELKAAPQGAAQEQAVRRLLPRSVLRLCRSRGRDAASERPSRHALERWIPRVEGRGASGGCRNYEPEGAAVVIFKPYYYFETGCAAYLFGCGGLGKCAVVDAHEEDVDAYVAFAASKGMRITHVIDTHVHADHRSGGPALAKKVGAAYCLHESADVALPFEPLHDGQEIELGNTRVKVLHTPGHTPESICLVVTDLRRGTEPWFVLTGDTLFVGAVGRPDLPGHGARERGRALRQHSRRSCSRCPTTSRSIPGHFAGSACGAGMSGKPSSTIAFEKRWNPLLVEAARRVRRRALGRPAEAGGDGADPPHQPGPRAAAP